MESSTSSLNSPVSVGPKSAHIGRRQWSLPRRLMSMGFTGLSRTASNIESKVYARNAIEEIEVKQISECEYTEIFEEIINDFGFTIQQIYEICGLSIASAVYKSYPQDIIRQNTKILICCGPGTSGGYGLVAARHLKLFGYRTTVYYPQTGNSSFYNKLVNQCQEYEIPFLSYLPNESRLITEAYHLIIDTMYYNDLQSSDPLVSAITNKLADILTKLVELSASGMPIISVDVPFGWSADNGPPKDESVLSPDCLVSLIAPKLCSMKFSGKYHYLGGRSIIPPAISRRLNLPQFSSTEQIFKLHMNEI